MSHSISSLYSVDERGRRTYDIDKMTQEQVEVVSDSCPREALHTRIKAGLLVGVVTVGMIGAGAVGFAVCKLAAIAFGHLAIQAGVLFEVSIPKAVVVLSKGIGLGLSLYGTALVLIQLWEKGTAKVSDLWAYASHLDQQAKDALLQKGYLDSLKRVS